MPLLVGLALLSMAAGARYGHPAPITATGASAAARIVPADLTVSDTPAPAGFAADADGARQADADIARTQGDSEQWGAYRAVPVAVVSAPASGDAQQPPVAPPLVLSRTTVPAVIGSRAPPLA